jgi:hypothetical protein
LKHLEAFLIHFRALAFFLEEVGNYDDDIHASDFGVERRDVFEDQDERHDINKLLAHLTTRRMSYDDRPRSWRPGEMYARIAKKFDEFRSDLTEDKKHLFPGDDAGPAFWTDLPVFTTSGVGEPTLITFDSPIHSRGGVGQAVTRDARAL